MARKKVILIVTSALAQNTRASKEIRTLTQEGYLVTFLGWHRSPRAPAVGDPKMAASLKKVLLKLKAPLGTKIIFFYPIWWCFVFFSLMVREWDILHAINFDSIPPALAAAKLKRRPVIYEILDGYEDSLPLPKLIRDIGVSLDKSLMRLSNGVVLADEMQIQEFGRIPNSRVVPVYDSPPDMNIYGNLIVGDHKNEIFTLFYGGILSSGRLLNLDNIFTAIRDIGGIKVIIAGWGDLVEEIKRWSDQMPGKIQFIGAISHAEVLKRSITSDLLFMLRSPSRIANKYICGSKMLEAMMCGKPILVNKGTSTAEKVSEENCGLVVEANNIGEIREAIVKLRDNPALCKQLGANARKAYEQKYGWHIMERRLLNLYHELTGKA